MVGQVPWIICMNTSDHKTFRFGHYLRLFFVNGNETGNVRLHVSQSGQMKIQRLRASGKVTFYWEGVQGFIREVLSALIRIREALVQSGQLIFPDGT